MAIIIGSSVIALILLIWFRTDAWLEYTRIFHLNWLSFYKEFDVKYKDDVSLTYLHFLRRDHNCFFIRLITCPICMAIWLGLILAIFIHLVLVPPCIVGGLLLFTTIDRLLG
jgi:hypothetical protein